jgi:hypothetical protein
MDGYEFKSKMRRLWFGPPSDFRTVGALPTAPATPKLRLPLALQLATDQDVESTSVWPPQPESAR